MGAHKTFPVANAPKASPRSRILTAQEWMDLDLSGEEGTAIIGTRQNPLIRPGSRNFIEAAEKSFKTTFALKLALGLARGLTVFTELPIPERQRTLYLHGELGLAEIKARTIDAAQNLTGPWENMMQGRDLVAHLIEVEGQRAIRRLVEEHEPQILVLDPWQSFITGYDENSFEHMSKATKFIDRLIEEFGVTVFLPIHLGKDPQRGARGHSTLAGWRDTRIQLRRHGQAITVTMEPRWATPPGPFVLDFEDGTLWSKGSPSWAGKTAKIRAFVESQNGITARKALEQHLGGSSDSVRKALDRAKRTGAIEIVDDVVRLPAKNVGPVQ
jgi:hypothetical protein